MAREALVKSRTAVKNRAKNVILPILRRHNTEQPRQIERQMIAMARPPLSQDSHPWPRVDLDRRVARISQPALQSAVI